MKEYMFIFRGPIPTPEQEAAAIAKMGPWVGQLIAQGRLAGGNPLTRGGKTLYGRDRPETDGPFMEGGIHLTGSLTVKAESLEEARDLALSYPLYETDGLLGSVEIREIVKMI